MICPDCGQNNSDRATFCVICGAQLAGGDSVFVAPGKEKEEPPGMAAKSLRDGRYSILKVLGEGGMGRVYLSKDTKMDYLIVIKEMLPYFMSPAEKEYIEKRFKEEAKLLFRLDFHGLPKVIDFFSDRSNLYIVMQFVEGDNLQVIADKRPDSRISIDECLVWMDEMLDIVGYLHNQNPPIIHRDIKPKNIMLNNRGEIYLVDFGLARTIGMHTKTGTSVGTYGYSSPEHYSGKFELSSDIFSIGATFHHLLSGDDPQGRDTFDYPPLKKYIKDFPQKLQDIFDKMLAMRKSQRFQRVEFVRQALDIFIKEYRLQQQVKPTGIPQKAIEQLKLVSQSVVTPENIVIPEVKSPEVSRIVQKADNKQSPPEISPPASPPLEIGMKKQVPSEKVEKKFVVKQEKDSVKPDKKQADKKPSHAAMQEKLTKLTHPIKHKTSEELIGKSEEKQKVPPSLGKSETYVKLEIPSKAREEKPSKKPEEKPGRKPEDFKVKPTTIRPSGITVQETDDDSPLVITIEDESKKERINNRETEKEIDKFSLGFLDKEDGDTPPVPIPEEQAEQVMSFLKDIENGITQDKKDAVPPEQTKVFKIEKSPESKIQEPREKKLPELKIHEPEKDKLPEQILEKAEEKSDKETIKSIPGKKDKKPIPAAIKPAVKKSSKPEEKKPPVKKPVEQKAVVKPVVKKPLEPEEKKLPVKKPVEQKEKNKVESPRKKSAPIKQKAVKPPVIKPEVSKLPVVEPKVIKPPVKKPVEKKEKKKVEPPRVKSDARKKPAPIKREAAKPVTKVSKKFPVIPVVIIAIIALLGILAVVFGGKFLRRKARPVSSPLPTKVRPTPKKTVKPTKKPVITPTKPVKPPEAKPVKLIVPPESGADQISVKKNGVDVAVLSGEETKEIKPGTYDIYFVKEGYEQIEKKDVSVKSPDDFKSVVVGLKWVETPPETPTMTPPEKTALEVAIPAKSGIKKIEFFKAGEKKASATLVGENSGSIEPGTYMIKFYKTGFVPLKEFNVKIEDSGGLEKIAGDLSSKWKPRTISISTNIKAKVYLKNEDTKAMIINGDETSKNGDLYTISKNEIADGSYSVTVKPVASGWRDKKCNVSIGESMDRKNIKFTLEKIPVSRPAYTPTRYTPPPRRPVTRPPVKPYNPVDGH
ncbi:MAG: protein kinase [Candidatus Eremiobacteraeota bacterium]|nr:protein kinase [Candidatus Eremiobacteraeota bacterium]